MGVELAEPLLTAKVQTYNYTNEGGVGGTVRFLKKHHGALAGAGMPPALGSAKDMSTPTANWPQMAGRSREFAAGDRPGP